MPLPIGDATPSRFYIGDEPLTRIYDGDNLIWAGLTAISDDFNRANNTTSLGPDWVNYVQAGTHGISSNRYASTGGDGRKSALNVTPLSTDRYDVGITQAVATTTRRSGIIVRSTPNFSSWIAYLTNSTNGMLVRGAGLVGNEDSNVTSLLTLSGSTPAGTLIVVEVRENVYTIKYGATAVNSYTDSGLLVPMGNRHVGVQSITAVFGSSSSAALDNFWAADVP
ncbi:hypothetical protein [Nocardia testacea]|uniref:hypothetical protein n=1 Tax=Nocardia testacea TaxID=248551 RepID=UPI0002E0F663|nr:hypothetical protein [Nocardia testacea]